MESEPTTTALSFGRTFTDHMAVADFDQELGWTTVEIVPFGDLALSPAAMVFHYGQAIFEGLKAFRQPDGSVAMFRPDENARRMNRSAVRMAMPPLPDGVFTRACTDLVRADPASVPGLSGESLYIRPMMIATEPHLGVRPASTYRFAVIASPVAAYFASGVRPISVWVTEQFVRAASGGTGTAKCAGNYGAGLSAKAEATTNGCDETMFLDASSHRWVEELGGMNVVFVDHESTIVAPSIQDTILDGVTRRSLLELARQLGYDVVERRVAIDEVFDGGFREAFACGTAAVVAPIGWLASHARSRTFGGVEPGAVTLHLRDRLVGIQEGREPDVFGWMRSSATSAVA